jgi:hypothetical protein
MGARGTGSITADIADGPNPGRLGNEISGMEIGIAEHPARPSAVPIVSHPALDRTAANMLLPPSMELQQAMTLPHARKDATRPACARIEIF